MSIPSRSRRNPHPIGRQGRSRGSALVWLAVLALLPVLTGCRRTFWAPDGRRIAVEAYDGIRIFDVATGKFKEVAPGRVGKRKALSPAWSRDGKRLAYFVAEAGKEEGSGTVRLETLHLRSGKRAVVVPRVPIPWGDGDDPDEEVLENLGLWGVPAWSPDGSRIAYMGVERKTGVESSDELGAIWIVGATGGTPRRLVPAGRSVMYPIWSPDGRSLVYSALRRIGDEESSILESIRVAGSGPRGRPKACWKAPAGRQMHMNRQWSADGRSLAIILDNQDSESCEVWQVSVAGGKGHRVAQLQGSPWSASFSAGLGAICFAKNAPSGVADRRKTGTLLRAPYGRERLLFKVASVEEEEALSAPVLSPDGRTVAMVFAPKGQSAQLRLHYTDGRPARSFIVPGVGRTPNPNP